MIPHYGSFPHHPNQPQSSSQQNSVPSQPQLGMKNNPQIPIPFNGVAMNMPNMPNSMANQPGFMNGPNNHLGKAQLVPVVPIPQPGRPHMGFGPQCGGGNMNNPIAASFPVRGFGNHNNNILQQFNQSGAGLPFVPNGMQGPNHFVAMQTMPNLSQHVPHNAFGPQPGLQNPGFLINPQFGNLHYQQCVHQHNLLMPGMDINAPPNSSPVVAQQFRRNSSTTVTSSNQTEQMNNNFLPSGPQGNPARADGFSASRGNWRNQSNKNFTRYPKREMQQGGSQNSQFHPMKNGRKNFGFSNGRNGRGLGNEKPAKFGTANSKNQGKEQRRSIALVYTEQEIQQWREERKKNYPSKGNVEKKLAEKVLNKEGREKEAKLRREQLKEILAKQAELGVEVAEIPGCYLSDKRFGQPRGEYGRPFGRNERFQNKFDKRGRYDRKDWYSKKQRLNDTAPSNVPPPSTRKPTLLEKLLLPEIKRDNSHLLQAFRFMVLNNFFDGPSDKPLKFPTLVVKDGSGEVISADKLCLNVGKDVSEASDKTIVPKVTSDDDKKSSDGANDSDSNSDDDGNSGEDENKDNDESDRERPQEGEEDEEEGEVEEEGEIIN